MHNLALIALLIAAIALVPGALIYGVAIGACVLVLAFVLAICGVPCSTESSTWL